MHKKTLLAEAVWYFLLISTSNGVATQVGPFFNQTACNDYRAQFAGNGGAAPCFSTTARE